MMPMHIPPTTDTDTGRIASMFPRSSPITKSLPPATQIDILGILQREQDRAMALLSSSPLLASLFISYANQATALESPTPSVESEEWKALENTISKLQEEINKLKPENLEVTEKLVVAAKSLDAFSSQVTSLKEVNATQRNHIDSLESELSESKEKYDRLVESSNSERETLRSAVSNLEVQQAELKEAIVKQQLMLSKADPKTVPQTPNESEQLILSTAGENKSKMQDKIEKEKEAQEKKELEEWDQARREARERAEREVKERTKCKRIEREAEEGAEEVPTTPKSWRVPSLKPTQSLVSVPSPAQKSGWGSWRSHLINNGVVTLPDRSPSPEPSLARPNIEDPPRGFTPNQPSKSQPTGFGSSNKPAWGDPWGSPKNGPIPVAQKKSNGPAWDTKPAFGPGTPSWGNPNSSTFGSGIASNLTVDTTTKPQENKLKEL